MFFFTFFLFIFLFDPCASFIFLRLISPHFRVYYLFRVWNALYLFLYCFDVASASNASANIFWINLKSDSSCIVSILAYILHGFLLIFCKSLPRIVSHALRHRAADGVSRRACLSVWKEVRKALTHRINVNMRVVSITAVRFVHAHTTTHTYKSTFIQTYPRTHMHGNMRAAFIMAACTHIHFFHKHGCTKQTTAHSITQIQTHTHSHIHHNTIYTHCHKCKRSDLMCCVFSVYSAAMSELCLGCL